MELEEYIKNTEKILAFLEKDEKYEECSYYRDLIKSVKEKDEKNFVKLAFDLRGLKKEKFLLSTDPDHAIERICHFFSLKNIFEYAEIDLIPYHLSYTPEQWKK